MKKALLILSLVVVGVIDINAGLFVHTRNEFEDDFPDHYPGRICMKDGTIRDFPAIRIWYTLDDEIWAWTNVEEFNKVTIDVDDVEWVEVWNAKAPDKKYRCFKYHNGLYTGTYMIVNDIDNFRIMGHYFYFAIEDNGDLRFHIFEVRYYNGQQWMTDVKGIPYVYVVNRLKNKISYGFGLLNTDGSVVLPKNIRSSVKSVLKGDKPLQKKVAAIKEDWTMELLIDILSQYNPSK